MLLYVTVDQLGCFKLMSVICAAVHYCRSFVLLYSTVGQLCSSTFLRSVVLLYITLGLLYCCKVLYFGCAAVYYFRSVLLLYITVDQLCCCI